MPMFSDERGIDGWGYAQCGSDKGLRVRHATFWSAAWNAGLHEAFKPRSKRCLEGFSYMGDWRPLGDYRGLTGHLAFEGPMSSEDVRMIAEAVLVKPDGYDGRLAA